MGSITNCKSLLLDRLGRTLVWLFALVCAFLTLAAPAQAQSVNRYTNNTASATNGISDKLTPCNNPLKRTFTVGTSYNVSDVNIGLLMAHTYRGDLIVTLVSPAGTRVVVSNQIGGAADNFNVLLDDQAASTVSGYTANDTITTVPPYNNTFSPSNALSAFNGQNANGTWTVEVCDATAQDTGTFYQADLYLGQPPSVYADLSLAKSVSNSAPVSGANISYTLTVTNSASSPSTATGVSVRDLLPGGVNYTSFSGTGSYNSATGDWTVGSINPGQSVSLIINATVTVAASVTVSNSAEITASSVPDIDSTPNNAVVTEDDYASASFTTSGTRTAGTPPVLTCSAGTIVFDWDAQAWTAGSVSNSYTLTGLGSLAFAITNPNGVFLNNATYGGQSPAKQTAVTGGLATAQNSLEQLVDLSSQSSVATTTITLGTAVPALQFTIFDVDFASNQFADKVTVTGKLNGVTVNPTLTNGVANYVIGTTAYGDAASSDTQSNGNVVVSFGSAVDTIVISYGDHSLAPADPGQQGIALHDITLCKPVGSIAVSKVSSVISDPVNATTNPKAIPGAVMEYCILISNTGTATATSVVATDALPAKFTYTPGTMQSGTSCATAATAEDDDNVGADETDPFGAAISGTTVTATAGSLIGSGGFALKFRGTVN